MTKQGQPLRVAVLAGEPSGDHLGARLMAALAGMAGRPVAFMGVGGPHMAEQGLDSLFPLSEVAIMGPVAIAARLPRLLRLIRHAANTIVDAAPDVLVLIDSPEFTHAVARRVRRRLPDLPVVNYVSPTVWAWRPWRARRMRRYVDSVAAIYPFEPEVHRALGGPTCVYVGHPEVERLRAAPVPIVPPPSERPVLAVLPGSRASELRRHMPAFGEALERLAAGGTSFEPVLPAVAHLADEIRTRVADWPVPARVVVGEAEKRAVFASARAALAASGTVTLELALAGVPMVVTYRIDPFVAMMKRLFYRPHSVSMANLVLGNGAFPEFVTARLSGQALAAALAPLFDDGPERAAQLAAIEMVRRKADPGAEPPSRRAAALVLDAASAASRRPGAARPGYLRMEMGV